MLGILQTTVSEIKDAHRKMKVGKGVGPNGILIKLWKFLGDERISWLTRLFSRTFHSREKAK